MIEQHSNLLASAARLYERHRVNRPNPFNVFAVLRNEGDEVNLHSRFLHALLDHVDPLSGTRENLREFVLGVVGDDDFAVDGALVERESNHIDLLIANDIEAIVIENKIWAGDQEQQLQRYMEALVRQGYDEESIRLVYLTPFGKKPSEQSIGSIPLEQIQRVSYRDDLPNWLIGCQQRAVDDPGLRESIAQYRRLILRMTNNDYEAKHMNELKELLGRGDNVVLAHQISESLIDVEVELVRKFYEDVKGLLRQSIEELPEVDLKLQHFAGEYEIERCIKGRGRNLDSGLYYKIAESAWLYVGGKSRLWFGVYCTVWADADLHGELKRALDGVGGPHRNDNTAPWYRFLDELPGWSSTKEKLNIQEFNESSLRFLSSEPDSVKELARSLAIAISDLWGAIKKYGLTSQS
ncbi:MAG: PD-(D/E)XK nuclease family protein [Gammaproteobacteria bacterium]|nr:PD-(D/E)XK nuclease family protein [Gammaproteobacteria bacterium]